MDYIYALLPTGYVVLETVFTFFKYIIIDKINQILYCLRNKQFLTFLLLIFVTLYIGRKNDIIKSVVISYTIIYCLSTDLPRYIDASQYLADTVAKNFENFENYYIVPQIYYSVSNKQIYILSILIFISTILSTILEKFLKKHQQRQIKHQFKYNMQVVLQDKNITINNYICYDKKLGIYVTENNAGLTILYHLSILLPYVYLLMILNSGMQHIIKMWKKLSLNFKLSPLFGQFIQIDFLDGRMIVAVLLFLFGILYDGFWILDYGMWICCEQPYTFHAEYVHIYKKLDDKQKPFKYYYLDKNNILQASNEKLEGLKEVDEKEAYQWIKQNASIKKLYFIKKIINWKEWF